MNLSYGRVILKGKLFGLMVRTVKNVCGSMVFNVNGKGLFIFSC
jgi:hypothetical protein